MQEATCSVPCSPVRAEPSHRSEMVNQLIFGEDCHILELLKEEWVHIESNLDGYKGYCQLSHITDVENRENAWRIMLTTDWVTSIECYGTTMKVPLGSRIKVLENSELNRGSNSAGIPVSLWDPEVADKDFNQLENLSLQFLNTAYLWGGKTVFGTDCSGFTQTIFQFFNIKLQRDAWQQAEQGFSVNTLEDAQPSDLAFFESHGGKITHVGIIMSNSAIIHASGRVRIDRLDQEGIINKESGKRTHVLNRIKRFF